IQRLLLRGYRLGQFAGLLRSGQQRATGAGHLGDAGSASCIWLTQSSICELLTAVCWFNSCIWAVVRDSCCSLSSTCRPDCSTAAPVRSASATAMLRGRGLNHGATPTVLMGSRKPDHVLITSPLGLSSKTGSAAPLRSSQDTRVAQFDRQ